MSVVYTACQLQAGGATLSDLALEEGGSGSRVNGLDGVQKGGRPVLMQGDHFAKYIFKVKL